MLANCKQLQGLAKMLPEFNDIYDHFMEQVDSAIADSHQKQLVAFSKAPKRVLYEGDDFERDSEADDSTWKHFEETVVVSNEDTDTLSLEALIARFAEIGANIGSQAAAHHQSIVRKHAEETGQLVNQQPTEELAETLLRLLGKADLGDEGGCYQLFCPPGREKDFNAALRKIDETPHLATKKKAIEDAAFERQRRREANRKLVD